MGDQPPEGSFPPILVMVVIGPHRRQPSVLAVPLQVKLASFFFKVALCATVSALYVMVCLSRFSRYVVCGA